MTHRPIDQPPDRLPGNPAAEARGGVRRPRRLDMHLSFDSLLDPAPVGTRSLHNSSRHLVFYSQNFALDLCLNCERSVRTIVVGQLLNRAWGPLARVPAYLISGDQVVAHSTTGRLGEFHMEGCPRGPMHLQLIVNDEELIDVELDQHHRNDIQPLLPDRDVLAMPTDVPDSIRSAQTAARYVDELVEIREPPA